MFEGGGGKGAAYEGVFTALTERNILPRPIASSSNIRGVAGASAGALTALFVTLGYGEEDLRVALKRDFTEFLDAARPGELRATRIRGRDSRPGSPGQVESYAAAWGSAPPQGQRWDQPFDKVDTVAMRNREKNALEWAESGLMTWGARLLALLRASNRVALHELDWAIPTGEKMQKEFQDLREKLKPLDDDLFIDAILGLCSKDARPVVKTYLKKIFGKSRKDLAQRVHALAYDRGLFSGFALRDYCASVIGERLKISMDDARNFTFRQLLEVTGCELCVSGTNVTQRRSGYFSATRTPDFPVAEAVAMSMSLPFVFKPVLVNFAGATSIAAEALYPGLWVDGGLLNNLPIHAFDGGDPNRPYESSLNKHVLAFRLYDGKPPQGAGVRLPPVPSGDDADPLFSEMLAHLGDIGETLLAPSEEGQLRTPDEEDQTIKIYAGPLSTFNFDTVKKPYGREMALLATREYFKQADKRARGTGKADRS